MQETVHTGAGLGAHSREHFIGMFICYLSWRRTKWAQDSWSSQDKTSASNVMQAPLSLYVRNFQILKVSPSYITLVVSASHNKYFPLIGLSYWKLNFLTPKTSWTSQRKACGCGKLPHDTRRVFLRMRARTSQCEHSLFIHVWTFHAGPQCGPRSAGPHAPVWMHLYPAVFDFNSSPIANAMKKSPELCDLKIL